MPFTDFFTHYDNKHPCIYVARILLKTCPQNVRAHKNIDTFWCDLRPLINTVSFEIGCIIHNFSPGGKISVL